MSQMIKRSNGFGLLLPALVLALTVTAGATIHEIDISSFQFSPMNTVVNHGDTVRWMLVNGSHTTTSDLSSPKAWDSGIMNTPGQTFELQFTEADGFGPFPYHCTPHASFMKDTIRVALPEVPELSTTEITSGFSRPVFATSPPGDFERFFVVEQHSGQIKILRFGSGTIDSRPFLDLGDSLSTGNEQGLLGLAFHPDYDQNGYFYVNYTRTNGDTRIARYQVSAGDPDSADAGSETVILGFDQPNTNHNGGWIGFGPNDGYLYISTGDGGGAGDPDTNGQRLTTPLGKILRLDIDSGTPYTIPADNPFFGGPEYEPIWHYGLRNPWRCSFDRETGDFYIADVGQNEWEEVDYQAADDTGGINYGWFLKEGTSCYSEPVNCDPGGITTDPIHEYSHGLGCSVTGGYVYRGCAIPGLPGTYFFADYCSGSIWTLRYDGSSKVDFQDRTTELGMGSFGLVSFAEDNYGELYILMSNGTIHKILPATVIGDCNENSIEDQCEIAFGSATDDDGNGIPDECESFVCGDADGNGLINISDAVYLIAYIFGGGPAPSPFLAGDPDCNTLVNISDAVYLIAYIFGGGPAPCASCP